MTDYNEFDRFVAVHLADDGSGTAQAERLAALIDQRTGEHRQRPEWLALIKEPPMRTNSHVTVGSPTVRVAAILAATLLLAVALAAAGVAGQQLLAADGPIVVAQDGGGDFTTISEAVAAAEDGDEVLIAPGTYPESITIDRDIILRGDGPREEVILEFGKDGPTIPSEHGELPYGLLLVDTEATVSDLTIRGPNVAAAFVFVGGAPTLERVADELEGDFSGRPQTSVAVLYGAGGTIRDSLLDGPVWGVDARPMPEYEDVTGTGRFIVEDNVMDVGFWHTVADGSRFLRNTITDGGIELHGNGSVLVAENELDSIELDEQSGDGFTIRDNTVDATGLGEVSIILGSGMSTVEGNTIHGFEGNTITGPRTGIVIPDGASPTISGNQLGGLDIGIQVLGTETDAVIEGNRFCDNKQDLAGPDGASLSLDSSNEICADATAG